MDPRLVSYLYCFNVLGDYYACHEYGESLWLDSGRPVVLKGLIQAAVCLYHLQNGNVKGGYAMWQRAKGYLEPALPVYESIDLEQLIRDIDAVFAKVPSAWRNQVVSPTFVRERGLPVVKTVIKDKQIAKRLESWTLEPLAGEHEFPGKRGYSNP